MVDHSRSNRIIKAAHDRGDRLDVIRERLREHDDLRTVADLDDERLELIRSLVRNKSMSMRRLFRD